MNFHEKNGAGGTRRPARRASARAGYGGLALDQQQKSLGEMINQLYLHDTATMREMNN